MGVQSEESKRRSLILTTCLVIFFLVNEIIFRDIMFSSSLTFIENLQETCNSDGCFYEFMAKYVFSIAGDPAVIGPLFLIFLLADINKFFIVKFALYALTMVYILSILKALYGDPRPYWVDQKIIPYETYAEYGNPSGHALISMGLYAYLLIKWRNRQLDENQFITHLNNKLMRQESIESDEEEGNSPGKIFGDHASQKKSHHHAKKTGPKVTLITYIFAFWVLGIWISRSYLGMHAYNQVLVGALYGTYFCYLLLKFIDPIMDKFLTKLFTRDFENRPLFLWSLGILYAVFSVIPVILYIVADLENPINYSIVWNEYWKVVKADIQGIQPRDFAYIKCFTDCSVIGGVFGIIFGISFNNGQYSEVSPSIASQPKLKILGRIIVGALLMGAVGLPLFLIPIQIPNYILYYFFNENLALFMAMVAYFKFSPVVYKKFGLEIDGEFMQVPKGLKIET